MAFYVYRAKEIPNTIVDGVVESDSEEAVIKKLQQKGYFDIKVFKDRRAFPRLDSSVSLRYFALKPDDKKGDVSALGEVSISKNISAGGIAFTCSEDLDMGAVLSLEIELPDGKGPIKCLGKVSWKDKLAVEFYDIGLCFLDLTGAERTRILQYVINILNI